MLRAMASQASCKVLPLAAGKGAAASCSSWIRHLLELRKWIYRCS